MRTRHIALLFAVLAALAFACGRIAAADTIVVPAPELGSAAPTAAPAPADVLHDPLTAPAAAWSDLQVAQKVGWPLAILAGAVLLSRLLSRLGGVWARLHTGKAALAIGALSAVSCAAYNALAQGGSWVAVAMAAVVAGAAAWDAAAKKPAADGGGN